MIRCTQFNNASANDSSLNVADIFSDSSNDFLEINITIILEQNWVYAVAPGVATSVLVTLNFLFGTDISLKDLRFITLRPKPLIAAALCQFVLLPPVSSKFNVKFRKKVFVFDHT